MQANGCWATVGRPYPSGLAFVGTQPAIKLLRGTVRILPARATVKLQAVCSVLIAFVLSGHFLPARGDDDDWVCSEISNSRNRQRTLQRLPPLGQSVRSIHTAKGQKRGERQSARGICSVTTVRSPIQRTRGMWINKAHALNPNGRLPARTPVAQLPHKRAPNLRNNGGCIFLC
jgi:hypothetical protein